MAGMDNEQKNSGIIKTALTILCALPLGAILGFVGTYWMATEGKRVEILQESRRDAYIDFLKVQVKKQLDLQNNPVQFVEDTAVARRKISIYGDKSVVEALAGYWREIFKAPPCCGDLPQLKHDVAIYQSMRTDIMPRREDINDADMMLLQHFCKMPESEAEKRPCQ
jgi:hypothetical protein